MATEIFNAETFVAALVAALPGVEWEALGLLDNEQCWRTFPHAGKPFAVLVRSSIGPSGLCDGAGEDSIRAYCVTEEGDYFGGKTRRWVPRTTNWRTMLAEMVNKLADQIAAIKPCASCGEMVKPFVVKKPGPNKGRPFVKCTNDACEKQDFIWCDVDEAPAPAPLPAPVAAAPVATNDANDDGLPVNADGVPLCPHHGAMVRMASGKGWKCAQSGRWDNGRKCFANCNVSQFDDRSRCKKDAAPPAPAPRTGKATTEAPAPMPAPVAAPPAPSGKLGTNGPRMLNVPASAIRSALAALDDDNPAEVARILNDLLK